MSTRNATPGSSSAAPLAVGLAAIVDLLDVAVAIVADLTGDWFADARFPNIPRRVVPEGADLPKQETPSIAALLPAVPLASSASSPWPYTPADLEEAFVAHELEQLSYGRPAMLLGEAADIIDEGGYF